MANNDDVIFVKVTRSDAAQQGNRRIIVIIDDDVAPSAPLAAGPSAPLAVGPSAPLAAPLPSAPPAPLPSAPPAPLQLAPSAPLHIPPPASFHVPPSAVNGGGDKASTMDDDDDVPIAKLHAQMDDGDDGDDGDDDDDVPIAKLHAQMVSNPTKDKNEDTRGKPQALRLKAQLKHRTLHSVRQLMQCPLGKVTKTLVLSGGATLVAHHLPAPQPPVQLNGRLSSSQGRIRWVNGQIVCIEISSQSLSQVSGYDVYKTLLHEIGHAIAGRKAKHGGAWRKAVFRIGGDVRKYCERPHILLRSRLACNANPSEHVIAKALRAAPEWKTRVGAKCPRCDEGSLRIFRLRAKA